eukprot:TRINITY_DN51608_c0_g1_i1.p1 TRINITY_DN51608_c0_g1~~TRINITY_DN51608_c0_g1_i1.p1  ORF type:complete len:211 (-),score=35.45 TRINITY_DN51608_c0_g1_i1:31-609(-)
MAPEEAAPKKSPAEILAAFRHRIERKIAGDDPDKKPEPTQGHTIFLTTSAAVKRRQKAEEESGQMQEKQGIGRGKRKALLDDAQAPNERPKRQKDAAGWEQQKNAPRWAPKSCKTRKVKVLHIPLNVELKYLQELFEKATGHILEGRVDTDKATAFFTFKRARDAAALHDSYHGGEINGQAIQVEFMSDTES